MQSLLRSLIDVLHWDKVVSHRFDSDNELLFRIHYEDGDCEEFDVSEMMVYTRLAAKNDKGHDFTVSDAPKSRRKKRLSDVIRHAKSLPTVPTHVSSPPPTTSIPSSCFICYDRFASPP